MFKKKCSKCKKKISKNYDFCPFCGSNFKSEYDNEDYGFLGKNDIIKSPINLGDSFIDKVFNSAMKMLEKQIRTISSEMSNINQPKISNKTPGSLNVQFFVNGKRVLPQSSQHNYPIKQQMQPLQLKKINKLSQEQLKKLSELPKKEPLSKVRRFSGKVIYEFAMPGVENIDDVLINQLENSIEIKAIAKDRYYSKNLNINLPIIDYQLKKGNLILELEARN